MGYTQANSEAVGRLKSLRAWLNNGRPGLEGDVSAGIVDQLLENATKEADEIIELLTATQERTKDDSPEATP